MAFIEDTPETMIRTDLWNEMSPSELANQQDLLVTKMSALHLMVGANTTETVTSMIQALQYGIDDIRTLLDNKSTRDDR